MCDTKAEKFLCRFPKKSGLLLAVYAGSFVVQNVAQTCM